MIVVWMARLLWPKINQKWFSQSLHNTAKQIVNKHSLILLTREEGLSRHGEMGRKELETSMFHTRYAYFTVLQNRQTIAKNKMLGNENM